MVGKEREESFGINGHQLSKDLRVNLLPLLGGRFLQKTILVGSLILRENACYADRSRLGKEEKCRMLMTHPRVS